MGTNYYLHENACPHCGRGDEPLHIGKSSAGWVFALHVDQWQEIDSLEDWEARWARPGSVIKDEYGDVVSAEDMRRTITQRKWGKPIGEGHPVPLGYRSWQDFFASNHAEPGPNNLLRGRISAHCTAHGDGTWDIHPGEFS